MFSLISSSSSANFTKVFALVFPPRLLGLAAGDKGGTRGDKLAGDGERDFVGSLISVLGSNESILLLFCPFTAICKLSQAEVDFCLAVHRLPTLVAAFTGSDYDASH
jgi:hypothetical protein